MILIFPFAKITGDGKQSPKNYPHWDKVVSLLQQLGIPTAQVSREGEPDIGCMLRFNNRSFAEIQELLRECHTWISGDSFIQHMAWVAGEPGVVIFGPSDPEIFGHPENINLLKDRRYLREWQFRFWSMVAPNPDAFVAPEIVLAAVALSIQRRHK